MNPPMNSYLAKFEFRAPLAANESPAAARAGALLRSDTLFAALCHAWASLYGPDRLASVIGGPDRPPAFRVSSLFVFSPEDYYLPKPKASLGAVSDPRLAARWRRLPALSLRAFREWAAGGPFDAGRWLAEEPLAWMSTHALAARGRIASDRRFHRAAAFRDWVVRFRPGCGAYAVVQTDTNETANALNRCFWLLGDEGIGGRRRLGMGQFALATGGLIPAGPEWDFLKPGDAPRGVLLSLYAPAPDELERLSERGGWRLTWRGGWAASPLPRPPAKKAQAALVEEGSLAPLPCRGRVLDVTPDAWRGDGGHRVFRCAAPVVAACRRRGGES